MSSFAPPADAAMAPDTIIDDPDLEARRTALRRQAATRRADAAATLGAAAAGAAAADRLFRDLAPDDLFPGPDRVVSGFWPLGDEIDARPALTRFHDRGWRCSLPVTGRRNTPLTFRTWMPGDPMVAGTFGVMTPAADAATVEPDLLLVPLLAVDRAGHRLGYGGGFYDRTLERLRTLKPVLAVGLAFAAQEIEAVPRHGGDQPLDWLVTERAARPVSPVGPPQEGGA